MQPRTQRAGVAHGERLAVGIVPLHADGHALRERVELLAGEGVGDVGVLRCHARIDASPVSTGIGGSASCVPSVESS